MEELVHGGAVRRLVAAVDPPGPAVGREQHVPSELERVGLDVARELAPQQLARVEGQGARGPDTQRPGAAKAEGAVGGALRVPQHGEARRVPGDEVAYLVGGLEGHGQDSHPSGLQFGSPLAHLREVLQAGQSTQPAQEHEQHWLPTPLGR